MISLQQSDKTTEYSEKVRDKKIGRQRYQHWTPFATTSGNQPDIVPGRPPNFSLEICPWRPWPNLKMITHPDNGHRSPIVKRHGAAEYFGNGDSHAGIAGGDAPFSSYQDVGDFARRTLIIVIFVGIDSHASFFLHRKDPHSRILGKLAGKAGWQS